MNWALLIVILFVCYCGNAFPLDDQPPPTADPQVEDNADIYELSEQDRLLIRHFDRTFYILLGSALKCECY